MSSKALSDEDKVVRSIGMNDQVHDKDDISQVLSSIRSHQNQRQRHFVARKKEAG